MADLLPQVRCIIRRHDLLHDRMALVVGISGGPDSLCLLHLLNRMAPEMELRLHVAHLNHGLRGAEAAADERFVAEFAASLGLVCTVRQKDVAALASEAGLSLEEAARQTRYRFLAEVAADANADTIAVGHNADDQAETVLMHFLRGSGVAGLRGMLPKTPLGEYRLSAGTGGRVREWASEGGDERGNRRVEESVSGRPQGSSLSPVPALSHLLPSSHPPVLIRPLLGMPRSAIEAYCAEYDLRPRFDRSNEDMTFFRNRLRHELLPILEDYNPQIREVLAHTAEVLAADHQVLRGEIEKVWAQLAVRESAGEIELSLPGWRALPLGLQRATLREAIHRLRGGLRNINWEHVERAVWLARQGSTGQKATLAAGLELEIGYRTLRVGSESQAVSPLQQASLFQPGDFTLAPQVPARVSPGGIAAQVASAVPQIAAPLPLTAPGVTAMGGGWQIAVSLGRRDALPEDFSAAADRWVAFLDANALGSDLVLRVRQPGDRFQPQGLSGHSVKLNEFMINAKVPSNVRAGWPLLCGQAGIAWVCGLRVAEWALVRPDTQGVWIVRFVSPGEQVS